MFTEEEVALMPLRDRSSSRARLVDGRCNNFVKWRSGKVWRATKEQRISTQVWRIPSEKININVLRERPEEDVGVIHRLSSFEYISTVYGIQTYILYIKLQKRIFNT